MESILGRIGFGQKSWTIHNIIIVHGFDQISPRTHPPLEGAAEMKINMKFGLIGFS